MKHDDETLQAAIDAAMLKLKTGTGHKSLDTYRSYHWPKESPSRLALAKAFLAKLPEPQPILAAARGEAVGINGLTKAEEAQTASVAGLSKPDSTDWKVRAEKAEAELAALKSSPIGILRPLSEAGPVPDGCARILGYRKTDGQWALAIWGDEYDTHFADIRLPSTETPAQTVNENADPYARLKAYAKAGARIRFEDKSGWSEWKTGGIWTWCYLPEKYEVHPDDLHLVPEYAPANKQPKQQVPLGLEDVMPGNPATNSSNTMNTPQTPDYGEPWTLMSTGAVHDRNDNLVAGDSAKLRMLSCVNACAGMTDPAIEIEAMREAIKEAFSSFADEPESDAAWLLNDRQREAITKLQSFIKP